MTDVQIPVEFEVQVTPRVLPTEDDIYSFVCYGCALSRDAITIRFFTTSYAALHLGKHQKAGHRVPAESWAGVEQYGTGYQATWSLLEEIAGRRT